MLFDFIEGFRDVNQNKKIVAYYRYFCRFGSNSKVVEQQDIFWVAPCIGYRISVMQSFHDRLKHECFKAFYNCSTA